MLEARPLLDEEVIYATCRANAEERGRLSNRDGDEPGKRTAANRWEGAMVLSNCSTSEAWSNKMLTSLLLGSKLTAFAAHVALRGRY